MNKIKTYIVLLTIALFGVAVAVPAGVAQAYNPLDGACSDNAGSEVCQNRSETVEPIIGTVVNTLLYIVGIISVVVIIIAGIMYSVSGGDSSRVTRAKNMLLYAIIGLVVAVIAFALVNWVFDLFS